MAKKSWVQDPETGRLVPKDEYRRPGPALPEVLGDIEPFVSPVDGSTITSRSRLRTHNARHGVTDSRDYSHDFMLKRSHDRVNRMMGRTPEARAERTALIRRALDGRS